MLQLQIHRTVEHVWSRDPALDKKADGYADAWKAAMASGKIDGLPLKAGAQPTIWRLASLRREHKLRLGELAYRHLVSSLKDGVGLDGFTGVSLLRESDMIIGFGLIGVAGLQDAQGRPTAITPQDKGGLAADQLEMLHLFGAHFVNELANRILEISEPDPTSGQG